MKKKHISFILTLLGVISATSFAIFKFKNPVVEKVGSYTITKKDEDYRNQVVRFYQPEDKSNAGRLQLKKAFAYAEILKAHGHPVTNEVLLKEAKRIDEKTLMPEKLQAIKDIFKGDKKAYLKNFILPTYVERTIYYDFFLQDPIVQSEAKKKATDFLEAVQKDPKQFHKLAKKEDLKVTKLFVSETEGVNFEVPKEFREMGTSPTNTPSSPVAAQLKNQREQQKSSEGEAWVKEIVAPMKSGQVFNQLIDRQEYWMVVRLSKKAKKLSGTHEFETVSFSRADYGAWLEKEMAKVSP